MVLLDFIFHFLSGAIMDELIPFFSLCGEQIDGATARVNGSGKKVGGGFGWGVGYCFDRSIWC